jgi:hypothetical protein
LHCLGLLVSWLVAFVRQDGCVNSSIPNIMDQFPACIDALSAWSSGMIPVSGFLLSRAYRRCVSYIEAPTTRSPSQLQNSYRLSSCEFTMVVNQIRSRVQFSERTNFLAPSLSFCSVPRRRISSSWNRNSVAGRLVHMFSFALFLKSEGYGIALRKERPRGSR